MASGNIIVELPTDIIYVAGTVNGVTTVFVQDEAYPIRWRATVDVAEDNMYHISIQMYDEAGNISTYENNIEYILPIFVYDRTEDDVKYADMLRAKGWGNLSDDEKEAWMRGLKGCLNKSDLKRIENDIYVIAQLLRVDLNTNKDNIPDIPNVSYFKKLLDNVSELRSVGYRHSNTPAVPVLPINHYQKVNDIELILFDIYEVFNSNFHYYTGSEIYAGDDTGLLL